MKDQQLMADQGGLGDDGSESTQLRKADYRNDQMNEKQAGASRDGIKTVKIA